MKSDICYLEENGQGIEDALKEVEKAAAYEGLDRKQTLQLRLLAEELTGVIRGIAGDCAAEFWIEKEERTFGLHLSADVHLNRGKREQLVAVSSTGKNAATAGTMGKVASLFESFLDNYDEIGEYCNQEGLVFSYMGLVNESATWSLVRYKNHVDPVKNVEEWDELEKSIVGNLADDVTVSAKNHKVEITVKKTF